mmetsp:Transcript_15309/g.44812  ORF Transcript_15309/g.44812 Transcript_15309/m.44812 type:complete len:345 (+) Transcript_15309:1153-2187(+)
MEEIVHLRNVRLAGGLLLGEELPGGVLVRLVQLPERPGTPQGAVLYLRVAVRHIRSDLRQLMLEPVLQCSQPVVEHRLAPGVGDKILLVIRNVRQHLLFLLLEEPLDLPPVQLKLLYVGHDPLRFAGESLGLLHNHLPVPLIGVIEAAHGGGHMVNRGLVLHQALLHHLLPPLARRPLARELLLDLDGEQLPRLALGGEELLHRTEVRVPRLSLLRQVILDGAHVALPSQALAAHELPELKGVGLPGPQLAPQLLLQPPLQPEHALLMHRCVVVLPPLLTSEALLHHGMQGCVLASRAIQQLLQDCDAVLHQCVMLLSSRLLVEEGPCAIQLHFPLNVVQTILN